MFRGLSYHRSSDHLRAKDAADIPLLGGIRGGENILMLFITFQIVIGKSTGNGNKKAYPLWQNEHSIKKLLFVSKKLLLLLFGKNFALKLS